MEINDLAKNKLWLSISVFAFALFVIIAFFIYKQTISFFSILNKGILFTPQKQTENEIGTTSKKIETEQKICTVCFRRQIDGIYIEKSKKIFFPVAVVIENHKDARPQSGLASANFVIEAEVEGGITRFLAVYADGEKLDKIGPIRSARSYYVDWAEEFSALFAHCGGSPDALAKIIKDKVFDLNEFYKGGYFWRDGGRQAPHNIYTSTEKIGGYLDERKKSEGGFLPWRFKDDESLGADAIGENIMIKFKTPEYYVDWIYDKESNGYIRYLAGQRHKDADGSEIKAKNVIIQYVRAYVVDDAMRLKMSHIGEGKAIVCLDGKCVEGKWKKEKSSARTRFYDMNGEEFKFNAGTTWVEAVRPEREVAVE